MLRSRQGRLALAAVLVVIAVAVVWSLTGRQHRYTLTADFTDTTGLYVGNEVEYLGVPVGTIDAVTPMGTFMRVRMSVDNGISLPADAGAQIEQSALLTDRYVELGPAYKGGATLPADSTIPTAHTRSPISFDDLSASINDLVVALNGHAKDGHGIGDLVHVVATGLDGNGARIKHLITSSTAALSAINSDAPDLQGIAKNLDTLAKALGENDAMVHRFVTNMSDASTVVAGQTTSLNGTLQSLSRLMTQVQTFIQQNRTNLTANLRDVASVAQTIHSEQATLAHIFDSLPTGAENIARAFDPATGSLRVEIAARQASAILTDGFCATAPLPASVCAGLTNPAGTGLFDQLAHGFMSAIPGGM